MEFDEFGREHLCYTCKNRPDDKWLLETTIDRNSCWIAATYRDFGYEAANGLEMPDGVLGKLKTVDNGGGYWIVDCPSYQADKDLYYPYLHSELWKNIRRKRIERDGFQCVMCGSAKNLNVHHITYDCLYREDVTDLVTVCKKCHEKLHANDKGV